MRVVLHQLLVVIGVKYRLILMCFLHVRDSSEPVLTSLLLDELHL